MTDETSQKRSLTEISHLFLSSVRDKQTNGAVMPRRIPPGQARLPDTLPVESADVRTVDLRAEEMLKAFSAAGMSTMAKATRRKPPVTAVLAAHLNTRQYDRVKEYARHIASLHGRVGLIELDGAEFRLMSFEPGDAVLDPDLDEPETVHTDDLRDISDSLEEMNWDVEQWLLLVPNPRTPEARAVLREVANWTLLSTCDHDGVVATYRLLKGLAESYRPQLSLALLDGTDEAETQRVYKKLSGVCQQFLNWELHEEPAVVKQTRITEHLVLCCRPTRDQGQLAAAPQWEIVNQFLQSVKAAATPVPAPVQQHQEELDPMVETYPQASESSSVVAESPASAASSPRMRVAGGFAPTARPAAPMPRLATGPIPIRESVRDTPVDVVDLPVDAGPEAILSAILQQSQGELIECPVRAPMCESARLAITRDRQIVLLAVAREGLSDLRAIGQAYRWISENRALIGMAIPQFAIDPNRLPGLRLLVDHADITADVLHPILHADHVTVQAYRKLRWGGKTGLFLEAA